MNWEAIGAVGEVAGAAGVIASLLYLARQVKAGARASAVEAKLESTRLLNDFIDRLIQSPEFDGLIERGRESLDSLSREDYIRFSNLSLKAFWFFSAGYFQYRMETVSAEDWHEVHSIIEFWLRGRGCRTWWQKLGRNMYGASFVRFIDDCIAEIESNEERR